MSRRRMLHPEARLAELAAKQRARSPSTPGWRHGWIWVVFLKEADGTRHVRRMPRGTGYAEAEAYRDEEMATGLYEVAWMIWRQDAKAGR